MNPSSYRVNRAFAGLAALLCGVGGYFVIGDTDMFAVTRTYEQNKGTPYGLVIEALMATRDQQDELPSGDDACQTPEGGCATLLERLRADRDALAACLDGDAIRIVREGQGEQSHTHAIVLACGDARYDALLQKQPSDDMSDEGPWRLVELRRSED